MLQRGDPWEKFHLDQIPTERALRHRFDPWVFFLLPILDFELDVLCYVDEMNQIASVILLKFKNVRYSAITSTWEVDECQVVLFCI